MKNSLVLKTYEEYEAFFKENVIFLLWKYKTDLLTLKEIQKSIKKVS